MNETEVLLEARHDESSSAMPTLAGQVERSLRATGHLALRLVEVFVDETGVQLRGRVPSYFLKQVAQETALGVPGVHGLQNDLEVPVPVRTSGAGCR